jgi:hypothetical protein
LWLKPVIIATQEAVIRITVAAQPWQKVHKTPSQRMLGTVVLLVIPATWKHK